LQDGTERNIESISLIDAVLPEVIEQRKLGAMKGAQMKNETPGANGEEGLLSWFAHPGKTFKKNDSNRCKLSIHTSLNNEPSYQFYK
jgi:hypothetical protein